jgi:hypothetical protein
MVLKLMTLFEGFPTYDNTQFPVMHYTGARMKVYSVLLRRLSLYLASSWHSPEVVPGHSQDSLLKSQIFIEINIYIKRNIN